VVAGVAVVSGVSVTRAEASSMTGDDAGAVVVVVVGVGVAGATVVGVVVGDDS
jgi:hypothetical protein